MACLKCFCCLVSIFYTISTTYASGFFIVVDKVAVIACRQPGGPPRLPAGRLSKASTADTTPLNRALTRGAGPAGSRHSAKRISRRRGDPWPAPHRYMTPFDTQKQSCVNIPNFQFIGGLPATAVPRFCCLTSFPARGIINRVSATQSSNIFILGRKFLWIGKKAG